MLKEKECIVYCRVSTFKEEQSKSLETQKEELVLWSVLNDHKIIGMFEDRCSGRQMECRENLQKAIELANETGAVILITEISRLSRSVADIANLLANETKFIATRSGRHLSKEMILILAIFAESESDSISRRVSKGIQAEFLRNPESRSNWGGGHPDRRGAAAEAMTQGRILGADEFALSQVGDILMVWREQGCSLKLCCEMLTAGGFLTRKGKREWNKGTLSRLIRRRIRLDRERTNP